VISLSKLSTTSKNSEKNSKKNEREIAIRVLKEITHSSAYNNIALRKELDKLPDWEPYQKNFVTELVNGTLRNLILIDHILQISLHKTKLKKLHPFILTLLRAGVYQIRWMDKVPDYAIVKESVKIARDHKFDYLSGFVNAVLRNVSRDFESNKNLLSDSADKANYLSIKYSFPLWLAKKLIEWLGDSAEEFCMQSHLTPAVTICLNPIKTTRESLIGLLTAEGINCTESTRTDSCLFLHKTSNLASSRAFQQGLFHIMDEGAYLATQAIQARPGQFIIDLCAAPGGKSFALAGIMQNQGKVISIDIHDHKIQLIKNMAERLGFTCISPEMADASIQNSNWSEKADAVLLDAPCSGFGIIRKKPDIKYNKTIKDVKKMATIQRSLLSAAASYVKPGGILVYCTCTITPQENDDNINWFLENFPFKKENTTQILPSSNNDGFYIAKMTRVTKIANTVNETNNMEITNSVEIAEITEMAES